MPSNIELETLAIMRGEAPGAAMRKACEDFEQWWATAVKDQPRGRFINEDAERLWKNIARLAFLEGRGL